MSVSPSNLEGPYACVYDVGAYVGDFARACLDTWPDCRVESFEPLADPVIQLNGNWRWHEVAVGATHGTVKMHRCKFLPSSSVLPMAVLHERAFPYTKGSTEVEVKMIRLMDVTSLKATRPIAPALLKVDVQGYELEVLKGAGSDLRLFDAVVLEVSHETLYEGAPAPDEITAFLTASGMKHVRRVDEMLDPRNGRLLQSDEFYAR